MSQNEVYDVLKTKLLSGDDRFHSPQNVCSLIIEGQISGKYSSSASIESVTRALKRMRHFGLLDVCAIKGKKHYRLKKKILES